MKKWLLTTGLVVLHGWLLAQTMTLGALPPVICTDQPFLLSVSSREPFGLDNRFVVRVQTTFNGDIREYPASVANGQLRILLPNADFRNDPDYAQYQLSVRSSQPDLFSTWLGYFTLKAPIAVDLLGAGPEAVSGQEPWIVRFRATGTRPFDLVFSDSTRFTLTDTTSSVGFFPKTSGAYRVTRAQNLCGAGRVNSPTYPVTVQLLTIRALAFSPQTVCAGGVVWLSYNRVGSGFGSNNRFRVQLTGAGTANAAVRTELEATEEGGRLRFTLPASFPIFTDPSQPGYFVVNDNAYRLRIVATDPALTSPAAEFLLYVRPAPAVRWMSGSTTINVGELPEIKLEFDGAGPFNALLNTGHFVNATEFAYQFRYTYGFQYVSPLQTTTYRLQSAQSACGPITVPPTSQLVSVRNSAFIDSVFATSACEGQVVSVRVKANFALLGPVFVHFSSLNGTEYPPVPASIQPNGVVGFFLPAFPPSEDGNDHNFLLRVKGANFEATTDKTVSVFSKPTARFLTEETEDVLQPASVTLPFQAAGGGPFRLEFDDGTVREIGERTSFIARQELYVWPLQTTTYAIRSVTNSCGTVQPGARTTFKLRQQAELGIYVRPLRQAYCNGDTVRARFETVGTFGRGNRFRLQYSLDTRNWTDWPGAVLASPGELRGVVNFATEAQPLYVRVVAEDPLTYAAGQTSWLHIKPTVEFLENPAEVFLLPGESQGFVYLMRGGGPYRAILYDGRWNVGMIQETEATVAAGDLTASPRTTGTGVYTFRSVSNTCGAGMVTGRATTLHVAPFRPRWATSLQSDNLNFCTGTTTDLPFVLEGQADLPVSLTVQIASARDSVFRDVATGITSSPARVTWPTNLTEGLYLIRLVSTSPLMHSPWVYFRIRIAATARLTTESDGNSLSVFPGGKARLKVAFTGEPPYRLVYDDGAQGTSSGSVDFRVIFPAPNATYRLRAVSNACGYGTVSGEVRASVNPRLLAGINFPASRVCTNGTLAFFYQADGSFEAGNVFRLRMSGQGMQRQIDSLTVLSGPLFRTLPVPPGLQPGIYQFTFSSTRPAQSVTFTAMLMGPPRVQLSGGGVVNPRFGVQLQLLVQNPLTSQAQNIYVQLSDGTDTELAPSGLAQTRVVFPTQTTTYTIRAVSNECGVGQGSGTATVVVNPPSARQINTRDVTVARTGGACTGDTLLVTFVTEGSFSAGNRFVVQLSDSTGLVFRDIPTLGTASPLHGIVPAGTLRGSTYRVRVNGTDPDIGSGAAGQTLRVRERATARFDTLVKYVLPGTTPRVVLRFTGDGPWNYRVGTDFTSGAFTSFRNPDTLSLAGGSTPTSTYRVFNLTNVCGPGSVLNPSTVRIELITATEPVPFVNIRAFPNPTTGRVWVEFGQTGEHVVRVLDEEGRTILEQRTTSPATELNLSHEGSGVFFLHVSRGTEQSAVFRLLKP